MKINIHEAKSGENVTIKQHMFFHRAAGKYEKNRLIKCNSATHLHTANTQCAPHMHSRDTSPPNAVNHIFSVKTLILWTPSGNKTQRRAVGGTVAMKGGVNLRGSFQSLLGLYMFPCVLIQQTLWSSHSHGYVHTPPPPPSSYSVLFASIADSPENLWPSYHDNRDGWVILRNKADRLSDTSTQRKPRQSGGEKEKKKLGKLMRER